MPQRRFAALRADISRELDNARRLVAEAEEWQQRLGVFDEFLQTLERET
jgi:hypothetical protein